MKITRRKMLRIAAATGCAGLGLGVYAWQVEPRWIAYEHRDLPIPGLPDKLVGKTLVQLSDLHIGTKVDDAYLISQFKTVQSLSPDFVVYTGDFMDHSSGFHVKKLRALIPQMPKGEIGTAGVLGNHDFDLRRGDSSHAKVAAKEMTEQGIQILRDDIVEFDGLHIGGLEDYWSPRFRQDKSAQAIADLPECSLVLSHNPDSADLPIWNRFNGWILCGHTHGGQCRIPGFRPPFLPVRNRDYVAGEYQLSGGYRMYINRGVGHTMKVRFCVRPEITVFTLAKA